MYLVLCLLSLTVKVAYFCICHLFFSDSTRVEALSQHDLNELEVIQALEKK